MSCKSTMPRYYHNSSYHHQARFIKKVRKFLLIIFGVMALVGLVIFVDSLRSKELSETPSETTQVTTSTVSPSVKIFKTSHFQFQTPKSWTEIAGETTQNKFVYRSFDKSLIKQELTIYVNSTEVPPAATYVLPVTIQPTGRLAPGDLSEHCKKGAAANVPKDPQSITFAEVVFRCNPDSVDYIVVVGQKQGTYKITLSRPDETLSSYVIIYRNLTAKPDADELRSIIESFQTR